MKYHSRSRELLVTTKVAQQWQDNFNREVDMLIAIIGTVDNETSVSAATELMDVYHPTPVEASRKKTKRLRQSAIHKPFEFTVFRN